MIRLAACCVWKVDVSDAAVAAVNSVVCKVSAAALTRAVYERLVDQANRVRSTSSSEPTGSECGPIVRPAARPCRHLTRFAHVVLLRLVLPPSLRLSRCEWEQPACPTRCVPASTVSSIRCSPASPTVILQLCAQPLPPPHK